MNARNFLYVRKFNSRKYKLIADNKLETKERLTKANVPTTRLIAKFKSFKEARSFDWKTLPHEFVLKPASGYGGRGIMVIKNWNGAYGTKERGKQVSWQTLEAEVFGSLDGAYSLNNFPDAAFIEERVHSHSFFKKYTSNGVPDIRVIVFNKIPVMAMLRLPTVHSDGKANLHLGAVGIGIDLRTGITTGGVSKGREVSHIPGKKLKVRGIKIPEWKRILEIATQAQITSRLGFVGIDIVIDERLGPLVLEVNARPGLSIQIANGASLRTRMERVASMEVSTVARGVELAQSLFADDSLRELDVETSILGVIEKVTIYGPLKKKTVRAKIDTGAYRTSLDVDLVHELGLDQHDKLIHVRAGSGQEKRKTARVRFKLRDKEVKTLATYTERGHMRFPMIVGRRDLKGFLVDPAQLPEGIKVK